MSSRMLLIWIGALLIVGGVVYLAAQPIWRGRLSAARRSPGANDETLEPRRPGAGLGLRSNWPGLALVALGCLLMLAAAAV